MKILILGGGGFLGSHLTDALLDAGHAVRIFERSSLKQFRDFGAGEPVEWVQGDFLDKIGVARAVEGCDVAVHLVSTTLPRSSNENPAYDVESNVAGTIHLLDAACRHKLSKVVFASSGGTVYGIPRSMPIDEQHPTDPTCSYGICKLAIEKYLHLYRVLHGLDYCVLRLSNPFGERQRVSSAQGAVSAFLRRALRGETIEIWGDGSVVRDYFHVSDAARAFVMAIQHRGATRIFNIGTGVGRSLNEVLGGVETLLGHAVARRYRPARPFDVPVNILDVRRARAELGWAPQVSFSEGLSRTSAWMIANPAIDP